METSTLKEKLHSLIETSLEEKLIEVYSVFQNDYTDEFKIILNEEYANYQQKNRLTSKKEIDKSVEEIL